MKASLAIIACSIFGAFALAGFAQASDCAPCNPVIILDATSTPVIAVNDATATPEVSATSTPVTAPVGDLRNAITRARTMLEAHLQATKPKKPVMVPNQNVWVDVTVAIWNPSTDDIRLVSFKKNGTQLKVDPADDDVNIAVKRTNGINSEFVVDDGLAGADVVGIEYPIFKLHQLTRKKKSYELQDVIYVPYSDKLNQPEMVAWGKETLDGYIADVFADLRARGIMSRAFPGRLVADVVDPNLAKAIVVIEHAGDRTLLSDPRGTTEAIQVVIGTNQESAFAYSVSTAAARGLVQFIPSTYKLMTRRTELGLTPDFVNGMSDPRNAMKAEVAYLDAILADMPGSLRDRYATETDTVDEYLAAAYNGGDARVRKAIAAFGAGWSDGHADTIAADQMAHDALINQGEAVKAKMKKSDVKTVKKLQAQLTDIRRQYRALAAKITTLKASSLRAETVGYVKKLRAVLAIVHPDDTTIAAAL